jgi:hypothetical protein
VRLCVEHHLKPVFDCPIERVGLTQRLMFLMREEAMLFEGDERPERVGFP